MATFLEAVAIGFGLDAGLAAAAFVALAGAGAALWRITR